MIRRWLLAVAILVFLTAFWCAASVLTVVCNHGSPLK